MMCDLFLYFILLFYEIKYKQVAYFNFCHVLVTLKRYLKLSLYWRTRQAPWSRLVKQT